MSGGQDPNHIKIEEAARALAITQRDPRYAVWLKKEPGQLLDTDQAAYRGLFTPRVTSFRLANAVRLLRYVEAQMVSVEKAAGSPERLTYRHGVSALGFVLAKTVEKAMGEAALFKDAELKSKLGAQFDLLRETIWSLVRVHPRSALTVFRSQSLALPLIEQAMIVSYGVPHDPRLEAERAKSNGGAGYPKPLFDYLCGRAPQIGNLA
jgi:hypothetical protein